MSNISLKKPFKHFATSNLFSSAKVSVNESNTSYIQNGEVYEGTPDILWEHTVFIHDIGQIWNRGRYYNSQKYLGKLSMIAKDTSMMFDGITVVTLVDKNVNAMEPSDYDNYPGILPSIVVAPSIVSDIDKVLTLSDKGCDILSTGNYTYDSSASKAENYDVILEDMTATEQWLVEHGLFSNCYKYPSGANVQAESEFIQKYEEYGLQEADTAVNGLYQDNMLLNGKVLSTNTDVTAACQEIASDSGNWLIYILDTQNITNIGDLIEAIQSGVDNDKCIYLQIQEGISMRASAFNIGRSVATLPFRVYKDGTVDAKLSNGSIAAMPAATTSANGLMSSGDKSKLDGIAEGATANTGTITGITMNGSSKGTSGTVDLGTVLTTTTSSVTSGSTTPITSGGVYTALQGYETKLTFTTTSSTSYSATRNRYYRHTNTPTSLYINLPTYSLVAGDTCGFNFSTSSSFTSFTISAGSYSVKLMKDFAIEASKTYEVVAIYDGAKWLVTAVEFE